MFEFKVKTEGEDVVGKYDDGILTGTHETVMYIIDELKFLEETASGVPYGYFPDGKYLDDPLAVKLIVEQLFKGEEITFTGDVPELEAEEGFQY